MGKAIDHIPHFKGLISEKFKFLCSSLPPLRENTISFWEYSIEENELFLRELE